MERVTLRLGDLRLEAVRDHNKSVLVVWETGLGEKCFQQRTFRGTPEGRAAC